MHKHYDQIRAAGAEVVAVVVAPLKSVESWCQKAGIRYPMLADADHQVAEAYGVYDLLGDGLAAPAVLVIGTDGRVVWGRVARSTSDPVATQTILEQLP